MESLFPFYDFNQLSVSLRCVTPVTETSVFRSAFVHAILFGPTGHVQKLLSEAK